MVTCLVIEGLPNFFCMVNVPKGIMQFCYKRPKRGALPGFSTQAETIRCSAEKSQPTPPFNASPAMPRIWRRHELVPEFIYPQQGHDGLCDGACRDRRFGGFRDESALHRQ